MPLVIHPRVRKTVGRIAALTCVAVFVSSGAAFAAQCPTQSAKQKFSKWGDGSDYFLVPGGSFEGTPAEVGWTLSGATLTPGNEPFHINGATDDQSLLIERRWQRHVTGVLRGQHHAELPVLRTPDRARLGSQAPGCRSDPARPALDDPRRSPRRLAAVLDRRCRSPSRPTGSPRAPRSSAAMRFLVSGSGSWQIDDVYVDPYRAG